MDENFRQATITLSSQVTLRKEYFGGIVFDRRNRNIIEIDKSCYVFLKSLENKCVDVHEIHNLMIGQKIIRDKKSAFLQAIQNLFSLGIIEKNNNIPTLPVLYSHDNNDNTYAWLSAPETVHWAVTHDCHKSCHDCYVRRFHSTGSELNTDNSLMLIDAIADHGVFQLAIGGGEPFCRRDIFELVHYASLKGLTVHITTGRYDFNDQEMKELWDCSKILRKYRSFREKKVFKESWCGVCSAKNNCGGCRVFADDALGGDPGCPAPVLPSLRQIGKNGRAVDLKEYLTMNKTITVGEYMERYGVGQRTAIKELNSSRFAITESGKSGKKKIDEYYYYCENDILREVQGAVGYTSGGYPFAQVEEIIEWLDCDNYGYPAWIRNR